MMDMDAFNNWLQCYYQDGMNNLVDHNGRTIWFKGPAGPLKPTNAKSRGMKTKKRKSKTDDKDVHCVSGNLEDHESEENSKLKTKKTKTTKEILKQDHDYTTNGKNSKSSKKASTTTRKKKPFEYEEQNSKTNSTRTSTRTRKSVDYSDEK